MSRIITKREKTLKIALKKFAKNKKLAGRILNELYGINANIYYVKLNHLNRVRPTSMENLPKNSLKC